MKRSSLLFFALMLLISVLISSPVYAGVVFVPGTAQVTLQTDADANGYVNRGDTIRVRCNAYFTAPSDAWLIPPTAYFGSLGIANQVMADLGGNAFQVDVQLNNWNQNINYQALATAIEVYAVSNNDFVYQEIAPTAPLFDIAQVQGTAATAAPATLGLGSNVTIEITDNSYQPDPLGGTICTVNLTNIGGNATTPMTHQGGGLFRVVYGPLPAGLNYTGPFTISLNDPMLGHPAVAYQTNSVTVDTVGPQVDFTNTTVTIQSGNAIAIPGDVVRITATVSSYDNENVTVTATDLTAARANPALNAGQPLPLVISNGVGNSATWQLDVTLTEDIFKNTSVPFIIQFTDDAGNVTTVTRYLSIDLEKPNFVNPTANVLMPDGTDSALDVATTSCQLEFTATIPIAAPPDSLTVSIDLSPIGGDANYNMTRVGLSDVYRCVYIVPQGTLEDGLSQTFIVSARDLANNLVAQATTPALRIDNNPPVISGIQLTASTANITVGTVFTIQCTATGLETNGSVSVDLSLVGFGNAENLPHVGSNVYRRSFTLLDSRDPAVPAVVDGFTAFTVSANDTVMGGSVVGHIISASTNSMMVDNEPAFIEATAFESQHNLYPADAFGYVRIGDSAQFYAKVASAPVSVRINMLSLGQGNSENMVLSTNPAYPSDENWYQYQLTSVPEGLINRTATPFRVTARDDADNVDTEDIIVNIDNLPVKSSAFEVTTTYTNAPAPPDDTDPSIINLNKTVYFTVTLSNLYPDNATATIDLGNFGGQISTQQMTYNAGANTYTYNFINNVPLNYDSSGHKFNVTITDLSGNRTVTESTSRRVDNWRPTINTTNATIVGGGTSAKIGDTIRFRAEVINNENVAPVINLSNLGLSSAQAMTLISTDLGVSTYGYDAVVAEGTINSVATTWTVTSRDNDLNYDTQVTPAVTVDNVSPQLLLNLAVTGNAAPGIIRLGENLTFTVELDPADTTISTVTVDLTAIGRGASETLTITGSTAQASFISLVATRDYPNYRFTATLTDSAGNKRTSNSNLFTEVDCMPVTFSGAQIVVWQDNGDNPIAGISNLNDVIMVYASASAYLDAAVSACIGSGTVDFATATMNFNAARNRHEATFTVKSPGTDGWGTLTGSTDTIYFKLSALDNVSNFTEAAAQNATFTIRNVTPVIDTANTQISLDPNRFRDFTGLIPIFNFGNDTVGDRLVASITFAAALPMHRAWLDFSELGSGTLEMTVIGNTAETSAAGVPVSKFAAHDWVQKRVYLYGMDQAGNVSMASQSFWVDNVKPSLTAATFDGRKLTVNLSEDFFNLEYRNFEIVGSNPPPLNTPVYLNFLATAGTVLEDLSSFEITLAADHMREMAQWASTPIYLKVASNIATAPLTDLSGNELPLVNFYPITITDSTWREPARINQFTMTHSWPNTITLDMFFNKEMDPSSVVASNAVLTFANLTYDFTGVDYSSGYIFQPADAANFTWLLSNTHLRVVMSDAGRDWIARKLGTGATQLRFATRSAAHIFAYDSLGKPMNHVPTSNPVIAADNRPTPGFDFSGPPSAPKLDLASRTLTLTANDRLLLSTSDFDVANTVDPLLGMPQPTNNNRVSAFFGKAVLHDIDSGTNTALQLQPIDITVNNQFASTTVTLKLTDNDLLNVLNLFKGNATPIWRMAIGAGAFTNLWGTQNTAYLPSGNPGAMNMVNPSGYSAAEFAACGMNDKPPVSQKNSNELVFDIELFPPHIDDVIIPLQPQTAPVVRILRQSDDSLIVNGSFSSYSERTVAGKLRGIYRFTNSAAFPANLQRIPAKIEVTGITDIFGNTYSVVASYAYDLNTRNDTSPDGYTDTASAPIELDTQKPVVASIIPNDVIGRLPAGSIFKVNFDEQMDASVIPVLTLTSGANTMTFTFAGWTATATADFTNDQAFTAALPNGWWYYNVTGGRDSAGNTHDGTLPNSFPVQVRTYAPEVNPGAITLYSVQNTISNDLLTNQPWASIVGNAVFSIQYQTPPSLYLPHFLEIFDPSTNTRLGRSIITSTPFSTNATATFSTADFTLVYPGLTGPTNYATRIVDSALNQTETISTVVYDNLAPDVATFDLTGIGSSTATTWYYRPTTGNFTANIVTTSTTDQLRLAIYSQTTAATTTLPLSQGFVPTTYLVNTGSTLAEGNYTLSIVDMAGNIGTGAASKQLVVDTTAPTVSMVLPSDAIGNSPAGATQISVIFSEPMDASPAYQPAAIIATTSATIPLTFTGWADPLVATTAIFVNTNAITTAFDSGSYTYRVTGGRDLAGNAFTSTVDGTHNVSLYADGPFARIDNKTDQRQIYGNLSAIQTNFAFDDFGGTASTTLVLNYVAGPFNTPHSLYVYDNADALVGSYTAPGGLPVSNPSSAIFPDEFNVVLGADQTYKFRIIDSESNLSGGYLPNNLRYDTTTPTVTSITSGGPGIATDTGAGLTLYYSPATGDSAFTVVTSNNDEMRLLVTTTTATYSTALSTTTGTTHTANFGSSLGAGNYTIGAVDTAGHLAAYSLPMIADSTRPSVVAATPNLAGGLATGTGIFDVFFSEHMNTAVAPVLELQNGPATISMNLVSWIASDTARFTNAVAISSSFPVGSYSYIISGARDLAGNLNNVPAAGAFEVQLFTTAPAFTAQLVSRQSNLFGTTDLINRPFSNNVAPGVASLTFTYNPGHPYQTPHTIYMYDSTNALASFAQILPDGATEISLTHDLLGNPVATGSYSFRLLDAIGNLSATYTIPIVYDNVAPAISAAAFSNYSSARSTPLYYNEQLHGGLRITYTTNASDSLLFVVSGITPAATATFAMNSNTTTGVSSFTMTTANAAALAEGQYWLTAADMAGNMATGAASTSLMIIDRTAPTAVTTTASGLPVSSGMPGTATFTVTFNEDMNDLASATPQLTIATLSASIPCTFVRWTASDTAEFVNTASITIELPQGEYNARVIAWDLTGNKLDTVNGGAIQVRSRGPVVASFVTRSFQTTTATDTSEILVNQPFSMAVAPGAATMSITLTQAPDALPVYLHWTLNGTSVASAPITLTGLNATFTWDAATGPIPLPAAATTYVMRLADGNGDLSIESHSWRVDNVAPSVQEPVVSGGVVNTASATVFFNPSRHTFVNFRFNAVENEAPRLRVKGATSTDTYDLSSTGTNMWAANFEGRYSRGSTPKPPMPDGRYSVDMVDRAGNVALLASGSPIVYDVVIDTVSPSVSSYTAYLGGTPVTSFSPAAGNLLIEAISPEVAITDTGIFYLEVLNNSGVVIRKIALEQLSAGVGSFTAQWDGKDSNGNLVIDGNYRFRATDYSGNGAAESANVFARTSAFKVSGITQISSTTAKIWFNHEIDAGSLGGAPIVSAPALAISNLAKSDDQAVSFSVNPAFTHETSYTFTVTPGTIKSVFGAAVAAPDNTTVLVADGQGPAIVGVSFAGLAGQQEFKVEFDESYKAATAAIAGNYVLTDASGTINIVQATTQSDLKTVVLTAAAGLIENRDYQISATGIEDSLGNLSPVPNTYSFKGRDLTPPVLQVSAFSNPANENDIIVVVTSNEQLKSSPTLQVAQSNAPVITTLMQPGSNPLSYMMGVHLSPSYPGNGNLIAYGEDMAGNQGTGNNTFTIAYVSSTAASQVISADNQIKLAFTEESLKKDAAVKILKHELSQDTGSSGEIRTSLQRELRASTGKLRASRLSQQEQLNHSELVPVSAAYEIGIDAAKVNKGFTVHLSVPETASSSEGLGLFYQSGDLWKFVSADISKDKQLAARASSPELFAVMRDIKAPRINIAAESNTSEPFRTPRPEFKGTIEEAGSGLDATKIAAHINNGPAQPVSIDSQGRFSFKPVADLVNGHHELVIKASDKTGNAGTMETLRFNVVLPLAIGQLMQYPNPARRKAFIRISANSGDLNDDLVKVKIYDTAGHKVATLDGVKAVKENWGVNSRYLYDIPWDLRNDRGKDVANGVYFARIEVRDPINPSARVKKNFKLAVLR